MESWTVLPVWKPAQTKVVEYETASLHGEGEAKFQGRAWKGGRKETHMRPVMKQNAMSGNEHRSGSTGDMRWFRERMARGRVKRR